MFSTGKSKHGRFEREVGGIWIELNFPPSGVIFFTGIFLKMIFFHRKTFHVWPFHRKRKIIQETFYFFHPALIPCLNFKWFVRELNILFIYLNSFKTIKLNLFSFACGRYIEETVIPDDRTRTSMFSVLGDKLEEQVGYILIELEYVLYTR